MDRKPQFSIAYLMLVVFWWSLALAMGGALVQIINASDDESLLGYVLVLSTPPAAGAACGGLMLKMRFGFIVGCVISATLLLWFVFVEVYVK
jgi:hypothetical protein